MQLFSQYCNAPRDELPGSQKKEHVLQATTNFQGLDLWGKNVYFLFYFFKGNYSMKHLHSERRTVRLSLIK